MKVVFLLTITFFSIKLRLKAQNNSDFTGKILYNFKHIKDTNNKNKVSNEEMILYFNKDLSCYRSHYSYIQDSLKSVNHKPKSEDDNYKIRKTITEVIINDVRNDNQYIIQPWIEDSLYVSKKNDSINWYLRDSTKYIGTLKCFYAEAKFRGQHYSAWYTLSIPLKLGPWKLQGLPGIIVEARNTNNTISFEFVELSHNYFGQIKIPDGKNYITESKLKQIKNAALENPFGYLNNLQNSNSSNSNISVNVTTDVPVLKKSRINNPLEQIE